MDGIAFGRLPPSESEMLGVLKKLSLDKIAGIDGPKSTCPDLALLELDAAETILWSKGLDAFLDQLLEEFPPFWVKLSVKEKEKLFPVVFEDTNVRLSKYLVRRTLAGEKVSLARLAERVYSRQSQHFDTNRKRMRKRVVEPFEELRLWAVEEVVAKDVNGKKHIAGYRISAEKPLLFFFKEVYRPRRKTQIKRYLEIVNAYGKEGE